MTGPSRARVVACGLLVACAVVSGCAMRVGEPRITSPWSEAVKTSAKVPVSLTMQSRVFVDGAGDDDAAATEEAILSTLLARRLRDVGIMGRALAAPQPGALNLALDVDDERGGPIGLGVLSAVTLAVIPSWQWTTVRLTLRGEFRGRAIPPLRFAVDATEYRHLLLIPFGPFYPPIGRRMAIRRDAIDAIIDHLTNVVEERPNDA